MSTEIKATVAELERLEREASQTTSHVDACFAARDWDETALQAVPALLAELHRLWAIEDAAVSLREASEACQELRISADMAAVNYARRRDSEAREDLFAALDAKPTVGEQAERGGEAGK